jgi:hypothetical protein
MASLTGTSQTHRILKLLKAKGSVTNIELNRVCFRYGARLLELRREGHDILTVQEARGKFRYFYRGYVPREDAA